MSTPETAAAPAAAAPAAASAAVKYCFISVTPQTWRVSTVDAIADGHQEHGARKDHKDFDEWLAQVILSKKAKGYRVSVERNDGQPRRKRTR